MKPISYLAVGDTRNCCLDSKPIIKDERLVRSAYTYLHGLLERYNHYDIFYFIDNEPKGDGMFPVTFLINNKVIKATLFQWNKRVININSGLLVADYDKHAYAYAKANYLAKSIVI